MPALPHNLQGCWHGFCWGYRLSFLSPEALYHKEAGGTLKTSHVIVAEALVICSSLGQTQEVKEKNQMARVQR